MKMINPTSRKIEEILNEQTRYAIPKYQREFKWGENEAQELIEDINSYKEDEPEHLFLGNFIFEMSLDQVTNVVDGQQRLTSIMLLLIAIRVRAQTIGFTKLQHKIQDKITFTDSATAKSLGCRFIASESIVDLFEYMANDEWKGDFPSKINKKPIKRQINRIRPIYQFFYNQISGFDADQLSQFLRAIYNAYVVQIVVNNDEEALGIFERTNARGLELEVADLLKNYLFAKQVPSIDERWKEVLVNSDGTILRMLKYFYVSKNGYVSKPQLYRKLKEYASKEDIGHEAFTTELVEFSRFYSLTKDPSVIRTKEYFEGIGVESICGHEDRYTAISASLQALKGFGIAQFCPVAYAAIELLKRIPNGLTSTPYAKILVNLFETFEKYHFVNNVICERVGNEVENLYADTCGNIALSKDYAHEIKKFTGSLREKRAKWEEFKAVFADISYSSENIAEIYYIFDRLVNFQLQTPQRLPIYNPDPRVLRKSNNIEHFLPQSFVNDSDIDKATKENIDNIGNLLVIYHRTNSKLGNIPPYEKVSKLRGEFRKDIQNLPFVQDFLDKYGDRAIDWNSQLIRARAEDLAEVAFQKVWALN
jgi:hypothetical protein